MTGVAFTLTIDDVGVHAGLSSLYARVTDLTPVLEDIGAELESSTIERFETNIAPDGTPWEPSARARETGTPTLVFNTDLRESIHYVIEGDAVEVGSNLIYSAIHQTGGTITAKGEALAFTLFSGAFVLAQSVSIPKRSFLGMSANDNQRTLDILGRHLALAAGAA